MKKLILIPAFILTVSLIAQEKIAENDPAALDVANLMVMHRQGRQLPDTSVESNTMDVTFTVRNALLADRAKITVTEKSTGEIIEVKTVYFSSRDDVAFYTSNNVYPRRLHKDSVSVEVSIGKLTQDEVEVEVYIIDKKKAKTRKLKQ